MTPPAPGSIDASLPLWIRVRAASLLARCLRQPTIQTTFLAQSGVAITLQALSSHVPYTLPTDAEASAWRDADLSSPAAASAFELTETAIDCLLRTIVLALDLKPSGIGGKAVGPAVASAISEFRADSKLISETCPIAIGGADQSKPTPRANGSGGSKRHPQRTGLSLLVSCLSWPLEKISGNAALGMDKCAAAGLTSQLADAIDPIIKLLAHPKLSGSAKKNAALALGKLFAHDPFKQRIRDAKGMEMLFHLTKSGAIDL